MASIWTQGQWVKGKSDKTVEEANLKSLSPKKYGSNFKCVILQHVSIIDIVSISS